MYPTTARAYEPAVKIPKIRPKIEKTDLFPLDLEIAASTIAATAIGKLKIPTKKYNMVLKKLITKLPIPHAIEAIATPWQALGFFVTTADSRLVSV